MSWCSFVLSSTSGHAVWPVSNLFWSKDCNCLIVCLIVVQIFVFWHFCSQEAVFSVRVPSLSWRVPAWRIDPLLSYLQYFCCPRVQLGHWGLGFAGRSVIDSWHSPEFVMLLYWHLPALLEPVPAFEPLLYYYCLKYVCTVLARTVLTEVSSMASGLP